MVSKHFTVLLINKTKLPNPCHTLKNSVAVKRLTVKGLTVILGFALDSCNNKDIILVLGHNYNSIIIKKLWMFSFIILEKLYSQGNECLERHLSLITALIICGFHGCSVVVNSKYTFSIIN